MRKIVLEEQDIREFEDKINKFPSFAKNMAETIATSQAVTGLLQFMGSKIQPVEDDSSKNDSVKIQD